MGNNKIIQVKEETLKLLLVFMSEKEETNPFQNAESYFKEIVKNKDPKKMRYAEIRLYEIDKDDDALDKSHTSNDSVHVKINVESGCPTAYWDSIELFNNENSPIHYDTVHYNKSIDAVYTIRNKPIIAEKSFIVVNRYCKPEQHFSCMIK